MIDGARQLLWSREGSAVFELRRGETKELYVVSFPGGPHDFAVPEQYLDGRSWRDADSGYDIMTTDMAHLLICDVFSADTHPAKMALFLQFKSGHWTIDPTNQDLPAATVVS